MGITEFKATIGIWLLAQIFIIPYMFIDGDIKIRLVVDFGALILLIVMFVGLKLIGA